MRTLSWRRRRRVWALGGMWSPWRRRVAEAGRQQGSGHPGGSQRPRARSTGYGFVGKCQRGGARDDLQHEQTPSPRRKILSAGRGLTRRPALKMLGAPQRVEGVAACDRPRDSPVECCQVHSWYVYVELRCTMSVVWNRPRGGLLPRHELRNEGLRRGGMKR